MHSTLLTDIFAGKPADHKILVWQATGHKSLWFNTPEDIPDGLRGDTYFGLGASPQDYGPGKRCKIVDIAGIGALWLDIDVAGPAHKKARLPESQEAALELLEAAFPHLPPTYIIHSGHGLQAYWLLDKWLHIDIDLPRPEVQALLADLNNQWRGKCANAGYDADSVCDLARVMRLPGTTNHKIPDDLKTVEIISQTDPRYPFAQLRAAVERSKPVTEKTKKKAAPATIKEKPTPLIKEKWEALCEIDGRVMQTWECQRPDLPDQSASSYTIALGRLAHNAGWTDQEVYDLMYHFRLKHHWEPKPHALRKTVENIKASPSGFASDSKSTINIDTLETIEQIGEKLGIEITRLVRYDSSPPAYLMTIDGSQVSLGTIEGITEIKKFRNTVAAATGKLPNKFKADDWDKIVRKLLEVAEHDTAGAEATEDGMITEFCQAYLNAATVHKDRNDGLVAGEPWTETGCVHIVGTALRTFLAINLQERMDSRRLGLLLRSIGAEPVTIDHKGSKRSAWKLPRKVWEPK